MISNGRAKQINGSSPERYLSDAGFTKRLKAMDPPGGPSLVPGRDHGFDGHHQFARNFGLGDVGAGTGAQRGLPHQ